MPESQAQVRLAHAVEEGQARNSRMSPAAAREIILAMHGRQMSSLPERKGIFGRKRKKR